MVSPISPLPKEIAVSTPVEVQDSCNCTCCPVFMRRGLASPASAPSPSMKIWKTRHALQRSEVMETTRKTQQASSETFPVKSHSLPEKMIKG